MCTRIAASHHLLTRISARNLGLLRAMACADQHAVLGECAGWSTHLMLPLLILVVVGCMVIEDLFLLFLFVLFLCFVHVRGLRSPSLSMMGFLLTRSWLVGHLILMEEFENL